MAKPSNVAGSARKIIEVKTALRKKFFMGDLLVAQEEHSFEPSAEQAIQHRNIAE
jgi:hypothetical protein